MALSDHCAAAASILLLLAFAALSAAQPASVEKAMQLAAAGRLEEASSVLLALEKADPRNPEVAYRLGLILLKQNKLREARQRLESAAKLDPEHPNIRSALGLLHESLAKAAAANDAPAAANEFQQAIRLDPVRIPYYLELANFLSTTKHSSPPRLCSLAHPSGRRRFTAVGTLRQYLNAGDISMASKIL